MALEALGLGSACGGVSILRDVSVRVEPGQIIGVIGPNGAGKTTLLKTMAGLAWPDAGTVTLDGQPLSGLAPSKRAKGLAFLEQGGAVAWPLTSRAVVRLGRLPHGDQAAEPVERAMAACGVLDFADRPVSTLSGGERARVLLARALAVNAPYLLADEPMASLDPAYQLQTLMTLRDVAKQGAGVIVVLHDFALAARFCDALLLLEAGEGLAFGTPNQVLTDQMVERAFGVTLQREGLIGPGDLFPDRQA
jgi:iron complex transport system ATP-binding protein